MSDYTPTTKDVREEWIYAQDMTHGEGDDFHGAEFDRWFASEIEKAEIRGEVLATTRRIASENAELMRRLS